MQFVHLQPPRQEVYPYLSSTANRGAINGNYNFTVACSPIAPLSWVAAALMKLNALAIGPPGESQYSAVSTLTCSRASSGSSRPFGKKALYAGFHNSAAFLRSRTLRAMP